MSKNKNADFLAQIKTSKVTKTKVSAVNRKKLSTEAIKKTIARTNNPQLLMAMDATASREPCWNIAQEITVGMFDAVPKELEIALAYHGGSRLRDITPFTTNKTKFSGYIQSVRCLAGMTALNEILAEAIQINRLKVIVYIGDLYEEDIDEGIELASQLKLKGIKIFFFHDTSSVNRLQNLPEYYVQARNNFAHLAQITQGAVFPFDSNSPELVKSILEAIAYYSSRGIKALAELNTPGAQKLLSAMN